MIDAKTAAKEAYEYFQNMYPDQNLDAMLEEVELTDEGDKDFWLITLSYQGPKTNMAQLMGAPSRAYKIFKIDANSGEVQSMKIRSLK